MKRYKQTTTFLAPPSYRQSELKPESVVQPDPRPYLHTKEAGAWLPLIQSFVWGVIAGALALVFATANKQSLSSVMLWTCGTSVVCFGLAWSMYQRHWFRLASLERLTGLDLNGDGIVGAETQVETPIVRVQVDQVAQDGTVHVSNRYNLPATEKQLRSLAFGILAGVPFSEAHWTGRGAAFSTRSFRALRAELIARKLLLAVNPDAPAQGYQFNGAGRAILKHYYTLPKEGDK